MLFFISVAILVAGIAFMVHDNRINRYSITRWGYIGATCIVLGGLTVLFSIIIMLLNYIPAEGEHELLEIKRESLVFQYDHDMYDNDNDIGKKELMDDIQEFNKDLSFGRHMQRDPWIGIYIPNIYDDISLIELSK